MIRIFLAIGLLVSIYAAKTPYRLDVQTLGGISNPWNELWPDKSPSYFVILQGKALVKGVDAKKKVAKKYHKFIGDEVYTGLIYLPKMFMGRFDQKNHFYHAYIDWQPFGLILWSAPNAMTLHQNTNAQLTGFVVGAYQYLRKQGREWHSVRPGISLELEIRQRLSDDVSLQFLAFQKVFLPDERDIDGVKTNIFPHPTGVGVGFIWHFKGLK